MDQQKKIRRIVQAQIIECLNRFYAMETGMWGGPLDALIVRMVVTGKIEERLYDLSALANVLDVPVSTLHRKVIALERVGLLKRERTGRSSYLTPTEKTCIELDKSFDEMIATIERLYRGKQNIPGVK
ncbi:winged helix-turn-helix domain-containing protein [Brucella pituitosa]|uniref:winged helix-turn-helix domain-containing protein n=1 Tax=Brucella pituitosa TaxID=571256 RepID=UPI003F4A9526